MSEKMNQNKKQNTSRETEKIRKGFLISAVNHNFGAVAFSEDEWNHRKWVLQGLLDCESPDVTTKEIGGANFRSSAKPKKDGDSARIVLRPC